MNELTTARAALAQQELEVCLELLLVHLQSDRADPTAAADVIAQILDLPEFSLSQGLHDHLADPARLTTIAATMRSCVQLAAEHGIRLGQNAEHVLDFQLAFKDNKLHMDIYARQSPQDAGLSAAQTQALADEYQSLLSTEDWQGMHNLASRLARAGDYARSNDCLRQWLAAGGQPDADALVLMGTNHYFLGELPEAIAHYLLGGEAGAPREIVEYNVWEACGDLIQANPADAETWRALYRQHFPDGSRPL